jgi:KaiC/GvpD/RAD55 family RecA-like ATPase
VVERISTGINALDMLIEGGIPRATSGIIVSDRRSPGGFFGQQILWNVLRLGLKCAYFHTRYSSERELLEEMSGSGWNTRPFLDKGNLRISDYVALAELNSEEEKSGAFGRDIRKVEGRTISAAKLTKLTSQAKYDFALFDDIDLLLRKLDKSQFVDWAGTVAKLQRDQRGVALAVVYQANLPSDVMNLIDRLGSDCTIELRTNESPDGLLEHNFRVTRMKATDIARHGWTPYIKGKEGINAA